MKVDHMYDAKRKFIDDNQLLTPHPSSSTQYLPSSPTGHRPRILPSLQYARPNIDGDWYFIGRSSTSNDLALPSNNRLVSRLHVKLRYIEAQRACEVKCTGYNGCSLQISGQTLFIRRDTGIIVQINLNSDEGRLTLDVAGSLVEIRLPEADTAEPELELMPMPSSPVHELTPELEVMRLINESYKDDQQICESALTSSPAPCLSGIITPSRTPRTKRIKLLVRPDSSPAPPSPCSNQSSELEIATSSPLQLRDINLSQTFVSEVDRLEACRAKCLDARGKENIPPETEQVGVALVYQDRADHDGLTENSRVDQIVLQNPEEHTMLQDVITQDPTASEAIASIIEAKEEADEEVKAGMSLTDDDNDGAIGTDPEFVDMILTTLATSTISPAPIASFVPFFSPKTSLDQIEDFLRAQTAVSEVKRTGKDASGRKLRSTWYYEPSDDSDVLRRVRLEALQKPVRSTKKRHHQYYWQPVHLRTAAPSSGLIDNKPKKKGRARKQGR